MSQHRATDVCVTVERHEDGCSFVTGFCTVDGHRHAVSRKVSSSAATLDLLVRFAQYVWEIERGEDPAEAAMSWYEHLS